MGGVTDPSADQPTLTSQRLIAGRYRLRRVIGQGAMGVVWIAYDEVLHRPVAVKEVQLPEGIPEAEANEVRERSLREARAIAALTHPNVVSVYDVARQGADPFVVMELLKGRSLAQVVNKAGRLNSQQAAVVADAVAAALDAAHRSGVIHRDVKPGNVLVGNDGQVKLTDFGIARNVSEVTMTSRGLVLGTPAFMAPEVAGGEPVTSASDLWGLGATLFAAVEGRPPYDAGDVLATVNEVVDGEVPVPTHAGPLLDVITGLMVKDPAVRMSLMEVRRRIRPLLPEPGTVVFPPDESEQDAGPADDKPTTSLSGVLRRPTPLSSMSAVDSPKLAADPGPLPFTRPPAPPPMQPQPMPASAPLAQVPGPLPFDQLPPPPQPVRRSRRHPAVVAMLGVVAVVLFAAAAGGAFAATRTLAQQPLLPASLTSTSMPPSQVSMPQLSTVTVAAPVNSTDGTPLPGGKFSVPVPNGWTEFIEERKSHDGLPASAAVHWAKPDGTAELTVERFPNFPPGQTSLYLNAFQPNNGTHNLQCTPRTGACKIYLYRTNDTDRSTYFSFMPGPDSDMWVVSVTVPLDQESNTMLTLFTQIFAGFSPQS